MSGKRDYSSFENKFLDTLNKHASKKIRTFWGNQKSHINKKLRKAIIERSKTTEKQTNKTRNAIDVSNCKKQRFYEVKLNNQCKFSFQHVSEATVRKVVKSLSLDKASAGEILIKILKESKLCFPELTNFINESLTNNKFTDILKLSNITPLLKKLDLSDKTNYREVSILPLVSKVFEKIMYHQFYEDMENFLN